MTDYSSNIFGAFIDTDEITDGAVTLNKLDRTGLSGKFLVAQGLGNAPVWGSPASLVYLDSATIGAGGANNVSISNLITTAYTSLIILLNGVSSLATNPLGVQFNDDTGNNYSSRLTHEDGANFAFTGQSGQSFANLITSVPNNAIFSVVFWVSNVAANQKILNINGYSTMKTCNGGASWNNTTNTITKVKIITGGGTMNEGTTLKVYGVA
jgi:hypothetical protein